MMFTLITGASMGIGEAFAREFARRGHNLVLVARSGDRLQVLAEELRQESGVEVKVCVEDLSHAESPGRVYEFCRRHSAEVDFLVNCAGLSRAGDFDDIPLGKLEEIIMVNMAAMARITRLFLPDMVARREGSIINVASLGALQGVPGLGLYSATKAFVLTLSEALYEELKGKGVKVVAVCPGFINTGFFERAGHNAANLRLPISETGVVIKAAMKGLRNNKVRAFPTLIDAALVFSQRLASRKIVIRLAGFIAAVREN
ncbi:MAG: SDR family oxidoreductase [Chlorobium sp.]|nr:SDR family oxidoreductase [Chlorobium sp.]